MKTLFIDSNVERTTDLLCKAMLSQIIANGIFSCGRHGFVAEKRLEAIEDDYQLGFLTENERFNWMMDIYVNLFDHVQIKAVDDLSLVDPSSSILMSPSDDCIAVWAEENKINVKEFLEGIVNKDDYQEDKERQTEEIRSWVCPDDLPF
jgi:hypothetical protein